MKLDCAVVHFHLRESPSSPYVLAVPLAGLCVGAGALSPEKGGALRKQSTQGRRLGVAAVLCGGVFGVPLLLLHMDRRMRTRGDGGIARRRPRRASARRLTAWSLPSQLVRFEAATPDTDHADHAGAPATADDAPTRDDHHRRHAPPVPPTGASRPRATA